MTPKTPSSATSLRRLSVRPSIGSARRQTNLVCQLVEPELLCMLERRRLRAPRQHAGLDRLNLSIQIVALRRELIDLVDGRGQIDLWTR